jgi:hypothetical protein
MFWTPAKHGMHSFGLTQGQEGGGMGVVQREGKGKGQGPVALLTITVAA